MKKLLFTVPFVAASFATPVLADSNMSQSDILKRLNALESEVQSLRRQLRTRGSSSTASSNQEDRGPYFTVSAGTAGFRKVTSSDDPADFADSDIDDGFSGEMGLGYRFNKNMRGEVSYSVSAGENTDRDVSNAWGTDWFETTSIFSSLYYDIDTNSRFTPFIGAGLGSTTVHTDQTDGDKIGFGYQGKLGVSYEVSNSFDVFVEGVYQSTMETEISSDYIDPIGSFSTRLGTRFKF